MKRAILLVLFMFLFLSGVILIAAVIKVGTWRQILFYCLLAIPILIGSYFFLVEFVNSKEIKFDILNGDLVLFLKNGKTKTLSKDEVYLISFKNSRSPFLVFYLHNNERFEYPMPLSGVKFVRFIEEWWGGEVKGKSENIAYRRILFYSKFFNKCS